MHQMEWSVQRVLNNDTSAISTLRCLKLYLERLGCNFLDQESVAHLAVSARARSLGRSAEQREVHRHGGHVVACRCRAKRSRWCGSA